MQVQAAIMPIPRTESATRARPEGLRPESGGPSAVMVVPHKQSAWQKQWQDLQSKVCFKLYIDFQAEADFMPLFIANEQQVLMTMEHKSAIIFSTICVRFCNFLQTLGLRSDGQKSSEPCCAFHLVVTTWFLVVDPLLLLLLLMLLLLLVMLPTNVT